MQNKSCAKKIIEVLDEKYGNIDPFLNHKNVFEFLIAVILSAQTTDKLVNKVSPALFKKYPSPKDLKNAKLEEVERLIRSVNYYRTKAKNLIKCAKIIDEEYQGEVPKTIKELIELPGIGRKVANVIVSDYYKKPEGFVVDTHIKRVSYRLGFTKNKDPKKIEMDLMNLLPKKSWITLPKQLILIGREYCFPQKPNCIDCPLNRYCEKNFDN